MKKYFLLLTILFSSSLFSQLITYTSVRLDEGQNEDYVKIEDFWSKIHEATIAQDLATGWMIWEVIKEEGDEKASSRHLIKFGKVDHMEKEISMNSKD